MMVGILNRVEAQGPELASAVVKRLEAGSSPEQVRAERALDSEDVVAAIAFAALGSGEADGPPLVTGRTRHPRLVEAVSEPALAELYPNAPRPQRLALAAGLLQILDAWDASHHAAQEADDLGERATSAYWHGIAHRREPDPGNASYWFRRVGSHPLFPKLAEEARPRIEGRDAANPLIRGGIWDPFAFISFCTSARAGSSEAELACRLQRLEMAMLLETTARNLAAS